MRFLIIGDLHGKKPKIHYKDFDAIIAPGDFCSDKGIREPYKITYKEFLKNPENYREWWEITGKRKAKKIIKSSIDSARRIMKFLNSFNVPVYLVPGNWDLEYIEGEEWDYLERDFFQDYVMRGLKNCFNCDGKIFDVLKEYRIIGYGRVNGPELYRYRGYSKLFSKKDLTKNRKRYAKLVDSYDKKFKRAKKSKKPLIFLSHNVPFNTKLDKITDKKSERYGYHYGSNLVRKMILKHKPLVGVGGHMHEHFGKCKLGNTTVINSGFGDKVNTFMELKGNKIKKLEFYKG
jgi:Icc-related predicted phosphoesterase